MQANDDATRRESDALVCTDRRVASASMDSVLVRRKYFVRSPNEACKSHLDRIVYYYLLDQRVEELLIVLSMFELPGL